MHISEFSFEYPLELVAQEPSPTRDSSRLMHLNLSAQKISHHSFPDFPTFFKKGDLLILNNTKVIPARLWAQKKSGGKLEILLTRELSLQESSNTAAPQWECMIFPGKGLNEEDAIYFNFKEQSVPARIVKNLGKIKILEFPPQLNVKELMKDQGAAPLPPYIKRKTAKSEDLERYQSIFAQHEGAIAAPTASLHFNEKIFSELKLKGVEIHFITLHVGLGTFEPLKSENILEHQMQKEIYQVKKSVVDAILKAKQDSRPITAVGTTVVRSLESFFSNEDNLKNNDEDKMLSTELYITPPYSFKIVDRFLTNFHQPQSTPFILTCAFAGKEFLIKAYQEAFKQKYRLFSYGDCMLMS